MVEGVMGFYDDIVTGLAGCVGEGRRFPTNYALAKFCDVHPTQMARYIKGERSANLKVLCDVLDRLGARVDWGAVVAERPAKASGSREREYQERIRELEEKLSAAQSEAESLRDYRVKWEGHLEALRATGDGYYCGVLRKKRAPGGDNSSVRQEPKDS